MTCIDYKFDQSRPGGVGPCILKADTAPATFPITTADAVINGIPSGPDIRIRPGSLLFIVDTRKLYVMNDEGTGWVECGGAA